MSTAAKLIDNVISEARDPKIKDAEQNLRDAYDAVYSVWKSSQDEELYKCVDLISRAINIIYKQK